MFSLKTPLLCATLAANCVVLHAQTIAKPANSLVSQSISSNELNVVYIAGLDEVKLGVSGNLTLSSASLT